MFLPPLKSDAQWVYDDPTGVPETPMPAPVQAAQPKSGLVVRFPVRVPANPKAA